VSTKPEQWEEAKRRCRLSDDDIRKAKELGMQPRSLIKNIPSPSQQWMASVRLWVHSLHAKKFGVRAAATPPAAPPVAPTAAELVVPTVAAQPVTSPKAAEPQRVAEFRNREHPWPDRPRVPDLIVDLNDDFDESWERRGPPDESDIAETTSRMFRRQYLYRWGAQSVAIAMSRLPEVRKVAAFGAIAQPLRMQVPRFGQYRRYRIEVPHECADLDLAVWLDDFSRLKELKGAPAEGLRPLQDTPYGGIAHHQADLHVFDAASGLYRGFACFRRRQRPLSRTSLHLRPVSQARQARVPGSELRREALPSAIRRLPFRQCQIRARAKGHAVRPRRRLSGPPTASRRRETGDHHRTKALRGRFRRRRRGLVMDSALLLRYAPTDI
jgi:hypothetical protein